MTDFSLPENNPLLRLSGQPYGAPEFGLIKPQHYLPAMKSAVKAAEANLTAIKENLDPPTFENTVEALEHADDLMGDVYGLFFNMTWAASNEEIMDIEQEMTGLATDLSSAISLDGELFSRIKAVYDQRSKLALKAEQLRLLEKTYEGFTMNGALLDADKKTVLRGIDKRLAELSAAFNTNIIKAFGAYSRLVACEEELAGIPDRVRNTLKAAAEEGGHPGKWMISLGDAGDIMTYAENRALREELFRASTMANAAGDYDNRPIIMEMVRLRHERAQMLGYKNFAEMILQGKMAGSPDAVMDFLKKTGDVYRPAAEKDLSDVRALAKKQDHLYDLQPWDFAFYSHRLQIDRYALDEEPMRPYFQLEDVLKGLRQHVEKLFNVDMVETKGRYPVYHPDVKVYEINDKTDGRVIGLFYADYYKRQGKLENAAWSTSYRDTHVQNGQTVIPFVTNVCSFDKPLPDQPSLLTMNDIITVFHEFGHGLHALLSKAHYASLAGTHVKRDFVELPSQVQENWVQQKEVLKTFARHYKTGEAMPDDLMQKLLDAAHFQAGYFGQRMNFQSSLDMKWHMTDPDRITSVEELEDGVVKDHSLFPRVAGPRSAGFDHIFVGNDYAAGYYGYKWAEVLDADVFSAFKEKGLYDPETAKRLRDVIYARGDTEDPMKLFTEFMGRAPDPNALFRRQGLMLENDSKIRA